jgi:hypothetical protein
VYLPVKWLAKEYPELAELVRRIERRINAEFPHPATTTTTTMTAVTTNSEG